MSAARYTLVSVVVLCFLSGALSRPHEKKHKHRKHTDQPLILKEDNKKDIVLNDEIHHQQLVLPKTKQKDSNANLAFDILTQNSIKKGPQLHQKKKGNNHVFLDQEAISFDTDHKNNEVDGDPKDALWHNLYEVKEPANKVDYDFNKESVQSSRTKKPINEENFENASEGGTKTENIKEEEEENKQAGDVIDDSEEEFYDDEDGIEDDYDDSYEDYNYFEENGVDINEDKKEETVKENKNNIGETTKDNIEDARMKSLQDLIVEIYGGVLPYSASIENIKNQIKESSKGAKAKSGKEDDKKGKKETKHTTAKTDSLVIEKSENEAKTEVSTKDDNTIKLSDNKKIPFHQDMLESIDQINKDSVQEDLIKTTTLPPKLSTKDHTVRKTTRVKSNLKKAESEPIDTSKLDSSFKTPNVAETSPNPPTTKAVSVTAAPVKAVKEYIQSKPLQLCIDNGGCSPGRMCHNGVCVCGDATLCKSRHVVAVCGSDGELYPSHCELHRQACLQQVHIHVNHDGNCGQNLKEHFKIQPTYEGTQCEYRLFKGQEGILWGDILVPISVKSLLECSDLCDKKATNGGCFAFQYSKEKSGSCYLFEKPTDIIRHPNSDMDFYEQRRCQPDPDTECEYEPVNLVADHIYAMCNVMTSTGKSFDECRDTCVNCTAFTYRKDEKICDIHHSKACVDMMNSLGIVHYIKRCNEKGDICHVLEVIPGKSPFMCSKATSSVSSLIECHDACVHGRCEAFQYLTKDGETTTCEIFFDKSCIELLDKKKENYYVKRCTNPKDCNYEQIQSASMMPCRVTSTDMDTMEKCRNLCNVDTCFGFKYDYNSLDCSLYSDQSCVLGKTLNYVIKKCHKKESKPKSLQLNEVPTAKPQVTKKQNSPTKMSQKDFMEPYNDQKTAPPKNSPSNKIVKEDDVVCTLEDYIQFKSDLLRYHCVRFKENNCDENEIPNKGYIASLMFSYYDRNMNGDIGSDELWEMQVAENLEHISTICTLLDLLKFEVKDKKLDHSKFLNAFVAANAVMKEEVDIIRVTSTAGNGLEIKCGVLMSDNSDIVWRRNNIDLTTISIPDMAVFADGTLYYESVGLHHTGNYTCYDKVKPGVKEIHVLNVILRPIVKVSPTAHSINLEHSDIFIDCHVDGLPQPHIYWEVNDEPIPSKSKHYITTHHNGTLFVHDSNYKRDVGTYKCIATNIAGTSHNDAVLSKPGETVSKNMEAFYVFHKNGYTAYEPRGCETVRHVHGNFGNLKYIPEELDRAPSMCGTEQICEWGEAVNVQNKYIYSSQPEHNRIIIIDVVNSYNPVQIVKTDWYPVKLYYVDHLDEVWILCWNSNHDSGNKTVVVVRDASKDIRHHIVHTQPVGYRFDLVEDIFISPPNDLDHKFKHGYVSHSKQRGLYKIDLESMRYTKAVDLDKEDCIPKSLAFISIGGYIVVECHRPVQIIIDYITDSVISTIPVKGSSYVSPDSRNLVIVDKDTGHLSVFRITEDGIIKKLFDVTTGSAVSDATFFPSDIGTGYDFFLTGADTESIYPVRLDNGQVTSIKGKNEARLEPVWPWSRTVRSIESGDIFSEFIAAPTKSTLEILNARDKRIHCSYPDLDSPDQIVYTNTKL